MNYKHFLFLAAGLTGMLSVNAQNTFPSSGNVGIGTLSPDKKLTVNGSVAVGEGFDLLLKASASLPGDAGDLVFLNSSGGEMARIYSGSGNENSLLFSAGPGIVTTMLLAGNGNVGIGTLSPTEKLAVNGKIRAKEVKVEAAPWPDYVFTPEHRQPSLTELEQYIRINKHLPEIPTENEVKAEGISLGEMNAKLLKKIEELTLYLIGQQKDLAELKSANSHLEAEVTQLKGGN